MREEPLIDVVIAVHQPTRPIERAVGSVLSGTSAPVRMTVVVHNTEVAPIAERLREFEGDPRLRIVSYDDGIPSPAGPMNYGFDLATAGYVSLLGSDDEFEPGALDAWLEAAKTSEGPADAVIAPVAGAESRATQPSPPIRWQKASRRAGSPTLDPVKDRLAYRAAPLGLIGRKRFAELRFAEGLQTGEDQPFSATMWFTPGSRIVFPVFSPRYIEHADQPDRVTGAPRSVEEEFRSLDRTFAPGQPWMENSEVRLSLLVKFARVHFFDAARARVDTVWTPEVAAEMAAVGERLLSLEPRLVRLLSRDDERLFRKLMDPAAPVPELRRLLAARSRLRSFGALLPRRLRYALHAQAPLRYHLAGALLLRGVSFR